MSEKPEEKSGDTTRPGRKLDPAAARAHAEAEERRKKRAQSDAPPDDEVGGRGGLEPARYGDWEKDGIISDF